MEEKKNIVIYQSEDGLVKMVAIVDLENETIGASQRAMAELFGVNTQAITRHLQHIYDDSELSKEATCSQIEQVRMEGSRMVRKTIQQSFSI